MLGRRPTTGPRRARRSTSPSARQNSLWSDAWGALRRNPLFWIGSVLGVFFVAMAIVPRCSPAAPTRATCNLANSRRPPSAEHWFGFDQQGCDYLANVVYGARNSLHDRRCWPSSASLVLGVVIGAVAGYYGGVADSVLARITDIFFALPLILGALILLRSPVDRLPILGDRGPGAVAIALALLRLDDGDAAGAVAGDRGEEHRTTSRRPGRWAPRTCAS